MSSKGQIIAVADIREPADGHEAEIGLAGMGLIGAPGSKLEDSEPDVLDRR